MANKVISMQQIRAFIQLLEKGYSLRSISAQLGVSRQPVTLYTNPGTEIEKSLDVTLCRLAVWTLQKLEVPSSTGKSKATIYADFSLFGKEPNA